MEEIKKEFEDKFTEGKSPDGMLYWRYCRVSEVWAWIEERLEQSCKKQREICADKYLESQDDVCILNDIMTAPLATEEE